MTNQHTDKNMPEEKLPGGGNSGLFRYLIQIQLFSEEIENKSIKGKVSQNLSNTVLLKIYMLNGN